MGGHRRIATRLFVKYREHPAALGVLLSIDLDAARGRVLSARAYERTGGVGWRLAARLVDEYQVYRHELDPAPARRRDSAKPLAQRELRLLGAVKSRKRQHPEQTDDSTFREVIRMSTEIAGRDEQTDDSTTLIQSEKEEERSRADYFRRFAAARRSLIRDGERYPMPEQIKARAEALTEVEIDAILAEHRKQAGERVGGERKARTAEAMRRENRR